MRKFFLILLLTVSISARGQTKFASEKLYVFEYKDEFRDNAVTVDIRDLETFITIDLNKKTIIYKQSWENPVLQKILNMSFDKNYYLVLTCEGGGTYKIRQKEIEFSMEDTPDRFILFAISNISTLAQ